MQIKIQNVQKHDIPKGMIGLFFEDINYAADGGLYAEMLENRSFEFYKTGGDACDYYSEYEGGYGWSIYPHKASVSLQFLTGSPMSEENPHYMRVNAWEDNVGFSNKAYEGIFLEKGKEYEVTFWARSVRFEGDFKILVEKNGVIYAQTLISGEEGTEETFNFFKKFRGSFVAEESVDGAVFALLLTKPGIVEFDFVSLFPGDAVAGIFRKDLFEKLKDLKPGFLRFPGGCIVEGNTYYNRYKYKETLKEPWKRKNAWSRWAVHGNSAENHFCGPYAHYNQSFGIGFYEYFLLCELIGAKPLPVLNVGLACQFQSKEQVAIESLAFKELLQDAVDLIEFANGPAYSRWGSVRCAMGHKEPFGLEMIGIGNEQWQTEEVDFFTRYKVFERAIHEYAPDIKLIGSVGPDVTSEKYSQAWKYYRDNKGEKNFVYAVDEHYYVKPEWLLENVDFYDDYDRDIKVFAGEYAAHPMTGMNMPKANNLEGAVAEAAFMTGLERNSDLVVLASYAPLFARLGYAQWSPDMIWFDAKTSYASPSYYVQKLYAENMGDVVLDTFGQEKEAAKEQIYYSVSYLHESKTVILKIANAGEQEKHIELQTENAGDKIYEASVLAHSEREASNSIEEPDKVVPYAISGKVADGISLPPCSFMVVRFEM